MAEAAKTWRLVTPRGASRLRSRRAGDHDVYRACSSHHAADGRDASLGYYPLHEPREVQALGSAMVGVVDLSQETVSAVLDDFVGTIKQQTNLGLGTTDYVESVLKRALGDDKASTVLSRILPGGSTKGLEILRWMDARAISDMIINEHPQVIAIILSVLEYDVAADVLSFLPPIIAPKSCKESRSWDGTAVSDGRARADHGRAVLEQFFCPVIEFWRREDRGQNHELCEGRSRNLRDAVTDGVGRGSHPSNSGQYVHLRKSLHG